jgi:sugar-specific transcriptional regulator TrmB
MLLASGVTRLNIDAYNKERKREIAADTAKLISLATSLKTELDGGGAPSREAVHKAEEIEKLARDVKKMMNFAFGPDMPQ